MPFRLRRDLGIRVRRATSYPGWPGIVVACACFAFAANPARAELIAFPQQITLTRAGATQKLVINQKSGDQLIADLTAKATFKSSDPTVATVDAQGEITAVRDGSARIIAGVDGAEANVKVTVRGAARPFVWSFNQHVIPILAKYGCSSGACHGAAAGKNGFRLSLRNWDADFDYNAVTREASGRRIVKSDPDASLLLQKPTMRIKHGGGERFTADSLEYRVIREWIAAGVPGPQPSDPRVERLIVMPERVRVLPGVKQQIIVQAVYSDGDIEDTTRWAKFSTTDDSVVTVGEDGVATGAGPGEAIINVWFASRIGQSHISAPFEQQIDPKVFAESPRHNFIDEHVLAKLREINISPSGQCDDSTFIRRAYLDAAGILPTPEETEKFRADNAPDKRAKVIDALLARPEFTDHWTYRLGDILLLSSKKLAERPALLSFHRFVRDAIARNEPWDRFVRRIITASGSNLENGGVNYFRIHRETTDLIETTSQAFMGLSITCAKCHNHPLEKWTLNDYYGFANLVSRVKLKNGDRAGETILVSALQGDIEQPITHEPLPPRPLDADPIPLDSLQDRRAVLAEWLTSPENPYFTRAIVNRVWKHYLGRGLAEPEDDLRLTNPVSNELLMAALCADLIAHKYDLRHLMRTIMNSAAYQRSSQPVKGNEGDGKYYSRFVMRRLPAEVILDAYSAVTGIPTDFPGYPKGYRALQLADSRVASYFLDAFGRPERTATCSCERTEATTMTQALHVSNGETLNTKLRASGGTIDQLVTGKLTDTQVVKRIYLLGVSRAPSQEELNAALELLAAPAAGADPAKDRREKIEDILWAVVTSKEFLFNH